MRHANIVNGTQPIRPYNDKGEYVMGRCETCGNFHDEDVVEDVPTRFFTGNEVVAKLPEGTMLEVVGPGELEVLNDTATLTDGRLTLATAEPGDRIKDGKGREGTVVRLTNLVENPIQDWEDFNNMFFYVCDEDDVVRVANINDVEFI